MRKIGKTEYFYWLYDQIECTNFVLSASLLKLDLCLSVERPLEQTIKNIQRLQERLVLTKNKEIYFKVSDKNRTTISYRFGNTEKLKRLMITELSTKFKDDQVPIRVLLYLLIPENKFILIVTFNHVFTDGSGALKIFRELIRNIYETGQNAQAKVITPTPSQESLLPPSVKGVRLSIKGLKVLHRRKKQSRIDNKDIASYLSCPKERKLLLEKAELSKAQSLQLLIACRKRKISITSYLAAVQCSVIRDLIDDRGNIPIPIQIPFDNRSRLLPLDRCDIPGLYITIPELRPQINKDYDIWNLAGSIGSEIKRISDSWERYMTFQLFPRKLFRPDQRGVEKLKRALSNKEIASTLTNMGRIEKRVGQSMLTFVDSLDFAVAPARNCILCSSVVTYNEKIHINLVYNTAIVEEKRINDITDRYLSRLTILCNDQN